MWDHLTAPARPVNFSEAPVAMVLPHHAMVAREIGAAWAGLAAVHSPSVIYLVSPNHFGDGFGPAAVAMNASWDTVYGILEADRAAAEALVAEGLALADDAAFSGEHGISVHAAFVKRFFPGARFVPVILGWRPPAGRFDALADRLADLVARSGGTALIVGSVDFSHYQPRVMADFHDEATRLSLAAFDADDIRDREVDSPATLRLVLRVAEALDACRAERFLATNSDDFVGLREPRTTSHQFWAFFRGVAPAAVPPRFSVLVSGRLADGASGLASREPWTWDPDAPPPAHDDPERFLRDLRGEEDRFLSGPDLCLFAVPDSVNGTPWRREGGSLRVLGLDEGMPASRLDPARIRSAAAGADFLVVVYGHDGRADPGPLMRSWIDAGADAVIGRAPGAAAEASWHMGKPYWTSLGDFAGTAAPEASGAGIMAGIMAGIVFEGESARVYEAPVSSPGGYPRFSGELDPPRGSP